jgi:hypothetical protein
LVWGLGVFKPLLVISLIRVTAARAWTSKYRSLGKIWVVYTLHPSAKRHAARCLDFSRKLFCTYCTDHRGGSKTLAPFRFCGCQGVVKTEARAVRKVPVQSHCPYRSPGSTHGIRVVCMLLLNNLLIPNQRVYLRPLNPEEWYLKLWNARRIVQRLVQRHPNMQLLIQMRVWSRSETDGRMIDSQIAGLLVPFSHAILIQVNTPIQVTCICQRIEAIELD